MHAMLEGTENAEGLRHIDGINVYLDCKDLTKKTLLWQLALTT